MLVPVESDYATSYWSVIVTQFPLFSIGDSTIQYVAKFKYLGHIITQNLPDDSDIQREIRNMYVRTNMLVRKFYKCSLSVKIILFKTYCMCVYDVALWSKYSVSCLNKLSLCYIQNA